LGRAAEFDRRQLIAVLQALAQKGFELLSGLVGAFALGAGVKRLASTCAKTTRFGRLNENKNLHRRNLARHRCSQNDCKTPGDVAARAVGGRAPTTPQRTPGFERNLIEGLTSGSMGGGEFGVCVLAASATQRI
jgi:hypothetical protein